MGERLPIRWRNGAWEVLLDNPARWHIVENESDAQLISRARSLLNWVNVGLQSGEAIAKELEAAAEALLRNVGPNLASELFTNAASIARARGNA
jgi:hypothetical protein